MKVREVVKDGKRYHWYELDGDAGQETKKQASRQERQEITDDDYRSPSMPCPPLDKELDSAA